MHLVIKRKIVFKFFIVLLGFTPGLLMGQNSSNNKTFVRLGASQINITPEQPVIMSGYDARKTPSTGIHDSLFASALFFSDEQDKALLISVDIIGFPFAFVDSIKKMISIKTGLSVDNIMVVATHDHGGPAIHTYEDKLPQANEDYIQTLKEKLVKRSGELRDNGRLACISGALHKKTCRKKYCGSNNCGSIC